MTELVPLCTNCDRHHFGACADEFYSPLADELAVEYAPKFNGLLLTETRQLLKRVLCRAIHQTGRWIPVGERLPPTSVLVYAFESNGEQTFAFYDGGWFAWDEIREPSVTHWKPLTAPPKITPAE